MFGSRVKDTAYHVRSAASVYDLIEDENCFQTHWGTARRQIA